MTVPLPFQPSTHFLQKRFILCNCISLSTFAVGKLIYDLFYELGRMSPQEVKQMIAESQGLLFREQIAMTQTTSDD